MLILKIFKQLRQDEVKHISSLPSSPIPYMNLLLMLPYVYLQRFFWTISYPSKIVSRSRWQFFVIHPFFRNFIANLNSYKIVTLNLRTLPGVLTLWLMNYWKINGQGRRQGNCWQKRMGKKEGRREQRTPVVTSYEWDIGIGLTRCFAGLRLLKCMNTAGKGHWWR